MNTLQLGLMLGAAMLNGDDPDQFYDSIQKVEASHKKTCLPKRIGRYDIPNEKLWEGISDEMEYEEYSKIQDKRYIEYTLNIYNKLGIKIESEYDRDSYRVILPEGWEKKSTDHSLWFDLVDNNGIKRASIFEKAFDESFINFVRRYDVVYTDVYEEEITIYLMDNKTGERSDIIEPVIIRQNMERSPKIFSENAINRERTKDNYKKAVREILPDFDTDPTLYWDK